MGGAVDIDAMKSIVAIAEKGSISKAARHLNITQSALSRRIKALEERYGHSFLERAGGPGCLTPAGKLLLDRARGFLRVEQELLRDLRTLDQKGGISFVCTMPFGVSYLADILRDMVIEQAGGGEFSFAFKQPDEIMELLRQREFDIALIEHDTPLEFGDTVRAFSLPEDEVAFIASPHLQFEKMQDLQQVLQFRLYCKQGGSCSRALLESYLSPHGVSIDNFASRVFFDDFNFVVREVADAKGVSFMPCSIVRKELERGELIASPAPKNVRFKRARTLLIAADQVGNESFQPFIKRLFAVFQLELPDCLRYEGKVVMKCC